MLEKEKLTALRMRRQCLSAPADKEEYDRLYRCRNFASSANAPTAMMKWACSPAYCSVRTAVVSCMILHGSLRPVIAPQKMFIICADLVFWFVGLLSAQVCGIEAGLMAGNVAVTDKAGDWSSDVCSSDLIAADTSHCRSLHSTVCRRTSPLHHSGWGVCAACEAPAPVPMFGCL